MMKHLVILPAALIGGAALLGCSGETGGTGNTFPSAALMTLPGSQGKVSIEVRTAPVQPPSRGVTSVEYRITDKNGAPVDGLTLGVVPWMPDMGHGASISTTVTNEGGGRYLISDVELFMPGKWELRTAVTIRGPTRTVPRRPSRSRRAPTAGRSSRPRSRSASPSRWPRPAGARAGVLRGRDGAHAGPARPRTRT